MPVVEPIEPEDVSGSLQIVYDQISRRVGLVLNMMKTMAHSPGVLSGYLQLDAGLAASELDPKLRELAYLRCSELNGCDYCRGYHHGAARRAGLTERQVNEIEQADQSDAFDPLMRTVITFAEQLTTRARVEDAVMRRLAAELTPRQLVELTTAVALANFTNRFNNALGIELP